MPGYDKSRFKNLTKNESELLVCGICLAILCKPKMTACCEQAYCQECIDEWLVNNQTCPNDRKRLTNKDLINVPKIVNNMLLNIEIYCQFETNGCQEAIMLEFIDAHEKKCKFNPQAICENCLTIYGELPKHNCLNNLQKKYKSLRVAYGESVKRFDTAKVQYDKEIFELNAKIENKRLEISEKSIKEALLSVRIEELNIRLNECSEKIKQFEILSKNLQEKEQNDSEKIKKLEDSLQSVNKEFGIFRTFCVLNYDSIQDEISEKVTETMLSFEKIFSKNINFIANFSRNADIKVNELNDVKDEEIIHADDEISENVAGSKLTTENI